MICPKCNGVGRIHFGKEPEIYTNEEWLRICTTEELAEVFGSMLFEARKDGLTEEMHDERFYEDLVDLWLKQPHKEEP